MTPPPPHRITAALLVLAVAACAPATARQYARFQPTEAMMAGLKTPAFVACFNEASRDGLDLEAAQSCFHTESDRVEALMEQALAGALERSARDAAVLADQARWQERYQDRCEKENPYRVGWGRLFDLQHCYLDEEIRRTLWLDALGR